ncbi:MAG: 1,4-dihydroxy-6-naphthoate synthase [Bacteroidales bacterium]|nr:1,4-dihydroxy-6-naphthoate synthase [Bacteroidales bacterium]
MKLTLGFSPCPNDTYIFDALVHHKIDTEGLDFEFIMADVEELNKKAFSELLDITKVSYHAFLYLTDYYILLDAGSALGYGTGPLVIGSLPYKLLDLKGKVVAVPGKYTTANLLFSLALEGEVLRKEMVFSDIEYAVLNKVVDAGVIIHENRFTYASKGLLKIADLGEFWENLTGMPIPLGGIVANKRLSADVIAKFQRSLKRSIDYAFSSDNINDFIRCNAQEMSEEVMMQHIRLYVNKYSLSLGDGGRAAVNTLFAKAVEKGLISGIPNGVYFG